MKSGKGLSDSQIFLETARLFIKIPELVDFDNLYALQSDAELCEAHAVFD